MSAGMARARPATTAFFDAFGHLGDRLEVAIAGDREAGLDDVDAHVVERLGDLQLFLERHRRARALFAIAQRGVENIDPIFVALGRLLGGHIGRPIQWPG